MTRVFEMELPSTEKFVLLVIADHCNDEGENAWPSVKTISRKTCLNERTVQRALRALAKKRILEVQTRASIYKPTSYRIRGGAMPPGGGVQSPGEMAQSHPWGGTQPPGEMAHDHPNHPIEPSLEPSMQPSINLSPKNGAGINASDQFQIFWDAYPRKEAKKNALKIWIKYGLDFRLGEILGGLEAWKRARDPEYMPYAESWLNLESWKEIPLKGKERLSKHEQTRQRREEAFARARGNLANNA